jgi:hypothetical protein
VVKVASRRRLPKTYRARGAHPPKRVAHRVSNFSDNSLGSPRSIPGDKAIDISVSPSLSARFSPMGRAFENTRTTPPGAVGEYAPSTQQRSTVGDFVRASWPQPVGLRSARFF